MGKQRSGLSCLKRALAVGRSLQMPYEVGLAHFELARHATSKVEANRHLQIANKCFKDVGAVYDRERCNDYLNVSNSLAAVNPPFRMQNPTLRLRGKQPRQPAAEGSAAQQTPNLSAEPV